MSSIAIHNGPFPSSSLRPLQLPQGKDGFRSKLPFGGSKILPPPFSLVASGLQTPPLDENMAATYQVPNLASCENHLHHHSAYASIPAQDRSRPALNERPVPNEYPYNPVPRCPAPSQGFAPASAHHTPASVLSVGSTASATHTASTAALQASQRQRYRQPSASSTPAPGSADSAKGRSPRSKAMVSHGDDIPACISPSGGSLADFVAEITALFWFESQKLLESAEEVSMLPANAPLPPMSGGAIASQHFKKWVRSVLTTTQVTRNVVMLALLYIYRLKMKNLSVKGRAGSEYRLLTVALMLGNKFLDDNTYTNKTWAEVSGIAVADVHVMEVEFLSNMRYGLLTSKEEWEEWLIRLSRFWEFLQRRQRKPSPSPPPLLIPSPTQRDYTSPVPSPTAPYPFQMGSALPPPADVIGQGNTGPQSWPATYAASNALSPLALKPEPRLSHKRSFNNDDVSEPPAKRHSRMAPGPAVYTAGYAAVPPSQPVSLPPPQAQQPGPLPQHRPALMHSTQSGPPASSHDQARISVPNLTVNTTHAAPAAHPLSLPPLVPGTRAMSTVFSTTTYAPQQSLPATCGPVGLSASLNAVVTPTTSFPPVSYGTPTKRLSPQHGYAGSSPLVDPFHHSGTPLSHLGTGSGVHTPISHSPSVYLQQRNSPYKPVRQVNTLLHPPSSAFLQQYHFANALPPSQMHYQPLGRRHDLRSGIVPDYNVGQRYPTQPATLMLPNPGAAGQYQPHLPQSANLQQGRLPHPGPHPQPHHPAQYH